MIFKKVFCFIGIGLLITLSIIYFYPKKISREYNRVKYRIGDSNFTENIKIKVEGYYSNGLLNGDNFMGTITIGNEELTKIDMTFDKFGRGLLYYLDQDKGEYMPYGDLYTSNKIKEFTIGILEAESVGNRGKSWSGEDGLVVSAPAHNRDEAVKLSNNLMKKVLGQDYQIH